MRGHGREHFHMAKSNTSSATTSGRNGGVLLMMTAAAEQATRGAGGATLIRGPVPRSLLTALAARRRAQPREVPEQASGATLIRRPVPRRCPPAETRAPKASSNATLIQRPVPRCGALTGPRGGVHRPRVRPEQASSATLIRGPVPRCRTLAGATPAPRALTCRTRAEGVVGRHLKGRAIRGRPPTREREQASAADAARAEGRDSASPLAANRRQPRLEGRLRSTR